MNEYLKCFCGSNKLFSDCCQPLIIQTKKPVTAEQLMRSRYSAFNSNDVEYLITTLLPEKRQENEKQLIEETINNTNWLGLKIIDTVNGEQKHQTGIVEFVAFYQEHKNLVGQLHERSNFIQQNHQWFYKDGIQLPPIKIGRNDICFCGSEKKFKKCHGV